VVREIDETSDVQLTAIITCSNGLTLDEVYREHGRAVYAVARKVLNSTSEAEDVTQEVFLRLWNYPDRFDPNRGTLRAFLLAQAHARSVDAIRSLKARRQRELREAHCEASDAYDLHHQVWDVARADQVARALEELPDEERRPIELAFFDGHTYIEVAAILDQPEGTTKGRIRNGMRRMRAALVEAGIRGTEA
jgi:RNA polymerase sigma-70 factor (ECF subfamily)